MANPEIPSNESLTYQPPMKERGIVGFLLMPLTIIGGGGLIAAAFLPPESPYALPRYFWYADFRFWPSWVIGCCWLLLLWAGVSTVISLLVPKNEERFFMIRRSLLHKILGCLFLFWAWLIWYKYATSPLGVVFAPILSPVAEYIDSHFTIPLADYHTTGEGANPLFWSITLVAILTVLFIAWRTWFYVRRWRRSQTTAVLLLITILPTTLDADDPASVKPQKVETSVGIYDVQSKDDLLNFSAEDIRELVKMEDDRVRGNRTVPHPVLVYCFEEQSFQYTGGKYENAEIKYRFHTPRKIVPGKKYPLVVHLHGVGEAGDDNFMSLTHLHSILPLLLGPEQKDFFMLVIQCPRSDNQWRFRKQKDGTLDVLMAILCHIKQQHPIDNQSVSVFGLSSGGKGVWRLLMEYPHFFAAAVPVSCSPPKEYKKMPALKKTAIWTFCNKSDANASIKTINEVRHIICRCNGYMKLTQFDQGGHAAWRPAMDEYNCFAWMIAQKRGGWFNPPPERKVYQGRSLSESFYAFFLPLLLAGGLFLFQRTALCEQLHERIADRLYRRWDDEDEDDEEEEEPADNGFRILTDATGTKKIKSKVVGFQGDAVKIQSSDGRIATVSIKHFSEADQEYFRTLPKDGFRIWTDTTGSKKITAKLVSFLPDGKVRLESEAGKMMTVDPKFLCEADRQFLAQAPKPAPPPEGFRKWSNASGTQSFVAKFVGFQADGKALLQSQAGKTIPVPVDQLGQAEQEFLAKERPAPSLDEFRQWSDITRMNTFTAKLLTVENEQARFETQDGKEIMFSIDELAVQDQILLTQYMNEKSN